MSDNKMYEVYVCIINDVYIYIGSGKSGRSSHCKSGISHVYGLNRLFFNGVDFSVDVVATFKTKDESLNYEKLLIELHKPKFNIKQNDGHAATLDNKKYLLNVAVSDYNSITDDKQCSYDYYTHLACANPLWFVGVEGGKYILEESESNASVLPELIKYLGVVFNSKYEARKFCVSILLFCEDDWRNSKHSVYENWSCLVMDALIDAKFK